MLSLDDLRVCEEMDDARLGREGLEEMSLEEDAAWRAEGSVEEDEDGCVGAERPAMLGFRPGARRELYDVEAATDWRLLTVGARGAVRDTITLAGLVDLAPVTEGVGADAVVASAADDVAAGRDLGGGA